MVSNCSNELHPFTNTVDEPTVARNMPARRCRQIDVPVGQTEPGHRNGFRTDPQGERRGKTTIRRAAVTTAFSGRDISPAHVSKDNGTLDR